VIKTSGRDEQFALRKTKLKIIIVFRNANCEQNPLRFDSKRARRESTFASKKFGHGNKFPAKNINIFVNPKGFDETSSEGIYSNFTLKFSNRFAEKIRAKIFAPI